MLITALLIAGCLATPTDPCGKRKITIDIYEADIGNVVRLLADVSGKNIVYGDDVKGKVTIKLKQVPWDQALDVILKTKGLGMEEEGNVIRIAPQQVLDDEALQRLNVERQRELFGPMVTRVIPVNYARASEMAAIIKPLLTERGTISVDERTNTIIVKDVKGSSALRQF